MAGRARLYYQFNKNKDGSIKDEDQLVAKLIDSFYVEDLPKNGDMVPQKSYHLDYSFSDETEVRMFFYPDLICLEVNGETLILNSGIITALSNLQKKF